MNRYTEERDKLKEEVAYLRKENDAYHERHDDERREFTALMQCREENARLRGKIDQLAIELAAATLENDALEAKQHGAEEDVLRYMNENAMLCADLAEAREYGDRWRAIANGYEEATEYDLTDEIAADKDTMTELTRDERVARALAENNDDPAFDVASAQAAIDAEDLDEAHDTWGL